MQQLLIIQGSTRRVAKLMQEIMEAHKNEEDLAPNALRIGGRDK